MLNSSTGQELRDGGLLEHIYRNTYAFAEYNNYLGDLVKQLSHRFPRMDIFEIGVSYYPWTVKLGLTLAGAGTGSTAEAVLRKIGDQYSSYTYTDVSAGFFLKAQDIFKEHTGKMVYKTYDAEKAPSQQGYTERTYDLVIASNVLHATHSLETTLSNARKLLKPGGYLVMLEVTDVQPLRPPASTPRLQMLEPLLSLLDIRWRTWLRISSTVTSGLSPSESAGRLLLQAPATSQVISTDPN